MELNETQIVIRERGILEIMDLSWHILRRNFLPLTACLLFGVIPVALINHLLFGWMLDFEYLVNYPWRYVVTTGYAVIVEAPLATVFVTSFLGKAVFNRDPKISEVIRDVFKSFWRLVWCVGILRGVFVFWSLYLVLPRQGNDYYDMALVPLGVIAVMFIRLFRPYIDEIVILEQNPLRSKSTQELTIGRRSALLHSNGNQIFGRGLLIAMFSPALVICFIGGLQFVSAVFFHDWRQGHFSIAVNLQAAMWLIAGYMAIVRFLCYLDTRIRQEGWEVEILCRAEASKLKESMSR